MAVTDSLPSWNESAPKHNILTFVQSVVDPNSPDYVPPESRIAVFDNDGTLWSEQPLYTQLAFALDRVKALAPEHPEWRTTQPFQAVLENDRDALGAAGVKGLPELVVATHAGMTSAEFDRTARDWFTTARHPRFNRPYADLAYLPMVELLGYLRANGSRPTSSPAAASSSCAPFQSRSKGSRPSKSSAAAGRRSRVAGRCAGDRPSARARLLRRQGGQAARHPEVHRPAGRSPPSATPMAISRCSNGPPAGRGAA